MRERLTSLGELQCRVLQASDVPPRLAVVLCHGFGAPAEDLVPLADALVALKPRLADVRFVFPAAPLSLESYGYFGARAWWMVDVGRFDRAGRAGPEALLALAEDVPEGLSASRRLLMGALDALGQGSGLGMDRIVLGGFSQGAMLATDVALRLEEPPAALALFSGTVIARSEWAERASRRRGLEVLMSHGRLDSILPYFGAERLRDLLVEAGLQVDFVPFDGPHTIHPEALGRFAALIDRKLG